MSRLDSRLHYTHFNCKIAWPIVEHMVITTTTMFRMLLDGIDAPLSALGLLTPANLICFGLRLVSMFCLPTQATFAMVSNGLSSAAIPPAAV